MSAINSTPYQPEIDGLRAIAISAVVLFHLDVPWVEKGYLGVDMFFVLSGFLITRMIMRQMQQGTFEFGTFYIRRLRRLFPAYLFTIVLTLMLFSMVLPKSRLEELGDSAFYSVLHLSNFFWASERSNYFAAGQTDFRPLLHLWSLSVEEQFYLVWPVLLLLSYKLRQRWALYLFLCTPVALTFWKVGLSNAENMIVAFYYPHLRFFEFAIGALAWVVSMRMGHIKNVNRELLLVAGLLVLAAQFYGITQRWSLDSSFFITAVIVCVATLACILGSNANLFGRFLKLKPLVGLGIISYSLYLLHWPLITFYRFVVYKVNLDSIFEQTVLLLICLLVAGLCHRFVEQRFRCMPIDGLPPGPREARPWLTQTRSFLFAMAAITLLVAGVAWSMGSGVDEIRDKLSPPKVSHPKISRQVKPECGVNGYPVCRFMYGQTKQVDILVFGDSHLIKLIQAFRSVAKKEKLNIEVRHELGCPPLLNVTFLNRNHKHNHCTQTQQRAVKRIGKSNPKTVVLVGSWSSYVTSILSPIPTLPSVPSDCYELPLLFSRVINIHARCWPDNTKERMFRFQRDIQSLIEHVSGASPQVHHLHLGHYFCQSEIEVCRFHGDNGESFYRDTNHLSTAGWKHIHERLIADLRRVLTLDPKAQ